jgi:hypothetical protein
LVTRSNEQRLNNAGFRRIGAIAIGAVAISIAISPPANAATSTTTSKAQRQKQVADAVKPYAVIAGVVVVLSALIGAPTRRRRRGRPPRAAKKPTRSRRTGKPKPQQRQSPARTTSPQPSSRENAPPSRIPDTPWGRSAGASARTHADALERQRAAWAAGSVGEQRVGAELEQLPTDRWWVFHDVPRGAKGTNVDHLVIGVGGVFTVNTKNVAGNVWVAERVLMVSGKKTSYLPAAVSEARDVGRRLSSGTQTPVAARPLIVFLNPPTIRAMPADVTVLDASQLCDWLQGLPAVMTPQQAYAIVLVANQPSIWL